MTDDVSDFQQARVVVHEVLVVDDQPESCRRIRATLESAGYRPTFAREGGQAHGMFQMCKPDFMIVELILHGESGFEICEWIKQTDKSVPVLILTEIDLDVSRDLASRVGADGYLTKPFDPRVLLEMIEHIAQDVWERNKKGGPREEGRIRFACHVCGKTFRMSVSKGGLSISCPQCGERVIIPRFMENPNADSRSSHFDGEPQSAQATDPLSYVMVKCKYCGTNYHFTTGDMEKSRVCPKCNQVQTGSLLLARGPLTRAALASSRRVLIVQTGPRKGKKLLLPEKEVLVGRAADCDIRQVLRGISRHHCALRPTVEGIHVRDLGSRTGTFVNDVAVTEETLLGPGDQLRVGPLVLQVAGQKWITELDAVDQHTAPGIATTESGDALPAFSHKQRHSKPQIEVKFTSLAGEAAYILQRHWEKVRKQMLANASVE